MFSQENSTDLRHGFSQGAAMGISRQQPAMLGSTGRR